MSIPPIRPTVNKANYNVTAPKAGKMGNTKVSTSPDLVSDDSDFQTAANLHTCNEKFYKGFDDKNKTIKESNTHFSKLDPEDPNNQKIDQINSSIKPSSLEDDSNEFGFDDEPEDHSEEAKKSLGEISTGQEVTHQGQAVTHQGQAITHQGQAITHQGQAITHQGQAITHQGQEVTQKSQEIDEKGQEIDQKGYLEAKINLKEKEGVIHRGHKETNKFLNMILRNGNYEINDSTFFPTLIQKNINPNKPPDEMTFVAIAKEIVMIAVREGKLTKYGKPLTESDIRDLFKRIDETFPHYYRIFIQPTWAKQEQKPTESKSHTATQTGQVEKRLDSSEKNSLIRFKAKHFSQDDLTKKKMIHLFLDLIMKVGILAKLEEKRRTEKEEQALDEHIWILLKDILRYEIFLQNLKKGALKTSINERVFRTSIKVEHTQERLLQPVFVF